MRAAVVVASLLAVLLAAADAGLVHQRRRVRDVQLRQDQIPVTVVEIAGETPVDFVPAIVPSERRAEPTVVAVETEPLAKGPGQTLDQQLVADEVQQVIREENADLLKAAALVEQQEALKHVASQPAESIAEPAETPAEDSETVGQVRQATQSTPTQSPTPGNFVAQLIQSSPIGQFINQLTGGGQSNPPPGVAADQPATPSPTPSFPSPADALQSAQHVVQNAAQSLMNSTNSAFQGFQNYASSFTNQLQNTFSTLTGQQQQQQQQQQQGEQSAEGSTTRRPGPFQSFVSNLVGNPTAAPAAQQPGPLQGLISFFQGGNNNNNNNQASKPIEPAKEPEKKPEKPVVDDKLDADKPKDKPDEIVEQPLNGDDVDAAIATNEVRNSGEVVVEEDSFEEAQPNEELIVVNDDSADVGGEVNTP